MDGSIYDWFDEANGGWIIQKGAVVNKTRYEEEMHKLKDRQDAAKAASEAKIRDEADYPVDAPTTEKPKDKVADLEKRVEGLDTKLDAILDKLNG